MLITTTPTIEGKKINKYLGIVSGEVVLGIHYKKDFLAMVKDIMGGRVADYEQELAKGRDIAINEMEKRAKEIGANAIVGVTFNYETVGKNSAMLMISVSGTAVVVE